MNPALLCALTLFAADPTTDLEQSFVHRPVSRSDAASTVGSEFGWSTIDVALTTAGHSANGENSSPTESTVTPWDSVDTVTRGQSPTYSEPGDPDLQPLQPLQSPEILGAPPAGALIAVQPAGPRSYFLYENVIATPIFSQNTSTVTIGPGVSTTVQQFDWDFEYSPRFELGFLDPMGAGFRARYWHFDHSNVDRATAIPGSTVVIAPDVPTGAGIAAAPGNLAAATHSLRMSVLDVEFLKRGVGDRGLDFSFGLRYARMDQWLRGRVTTPAGMLVANNAVHHDFEGIGPTIATEYRRPLWFTNWSVFGNARASLLYGDSNYRYDRRNAAGVLTANSRNLSDQNLLGVFESQVGLEYRVALSCAHEFFFRAALEAQYWANAGSASADLAGFGSGSGQETDLGFLGVTLGTGLNW